MVPGDVIPGGFSIGRQGDGMSPNPAWEQMLDCGWDTDGNLVNEAAACGCTVPQGSDPGDAEFPTTRPWIVDTFLLNEIWHHRWRINWYKARHAPDSIQLSIPNPGADVDVSGWTVTTGQLTRRTSDPTPHSGAGYFMGGASSNSTAYADIAIPEDLHELVDEEAATAGLGWFQAGWHTNGDDAAQMLMSFLDSDGASMWAPPLIDPSIGQPVLDEPGAPAWL